MTLPLLESPSGPVRSGRMLNFRWIWVLLLATSSLLSAAPEEGFESIFDGTLKNWEGDSTYWRAENGVLIGEVKPETLLKKNSFIIWRGGVLADFELKLEYRVSAQGNSGINYRSIQVPDPETKWAMQGYQADIDGKDQWSGQNYEERGRTFLAYRGQSVILEPGQKPEVVADLGDRADLQKSVKKEDWNEVHLIVRGNSLQHFTNGILMSKVLDFDTEKRRMSGLLGVQVHVGPPMKIEYRNIRIKRLESGMLLAQGKVNKVSYTLTANGRPVRPEAIEGLRKAYVDLFGGLDAQAQMKHYETLAAALVATRHADFEVRESDQGLKPGEVIPVAESCFLEEALGLSSYKLTNENVGLFQSEESIPGLMATGTCWSLQGVVVQLAKE